MALNQLQTKAESALAAGSSIDEIAHIRIITKAGESRKATPAQAATLLAPLLAPQLAIDYSKLEEQIVPGEFWLDPTTGQRRQVYQITFRGTTAPTTAPMTIMSGLTDYQVIRGTIATTGYALKFNTIANSGSSFVSNLTAELTVYAGVLSMTCHQHYTQSKPYVLTIKYTKA